MERIILDQEYISLEVQKICNYSNILNSVYQTIFDPESEQGYEKNNITQNMIEFQSYDDFGDLNLRDTLLVSNLFTVTSTPMNFTSIDSGTPSDSEKIGDYQFSIYKDSSKLNYSKIQPVKDTKGYKKQFPQEYDEVLIGLSYISTYTSNEQLQKRLVYQIDSDKIDPDILVFSLARFLYLCQKYPTKFKKYENIKILILTDSDTIAKNKMKGWEIYYRYQLEVKNALQICELMYRKIGTKYGFPDSNWKENYKIFSLNSIFDKKFNIKDYFQLNDDSITDSIKEERINKLLMLDFASKIFLYDILEKSNYCKKGTYWQPCYDIKFTIQ